MSSIQTFYDVLFALVLMAGISAGLALAFVAAGAMHERQQARSGVAGSPVLAELARNEDARELTRR
jgi:hypothetical protein